jgi:hypothetical protein
MGSRSCRPHPRRSAASSADVGGPTSWPRCRLGAFAPENLERFAVIAPARFRDRSPDDTVALALTPDDVMVVVAGGPGKHSATVPTFGATRAVTVRIPDWRSARQAPPSARWPDARLAGVSGDGRR